MGKRGGVERINMILVGDSKEVLKTLKDNSIQTCVTSPPYYGLRDYGHAGQIGLEETPEQYIARLVDVFREVRRVLKDDGTLWLNLGDSYIGGKGASGSNGPELQEKRHKHGASLNRGYQTSGGSGETRITDNRNLLKIGYKPKDLLMIPARVAIALQADGWYLRSEIIWHKPNPMPESVKDRPTKAHEMIYLLAKSQKYFYDADAVKEDSSDFIGSKKRYEKNFNKYGGGMETGMISRNNPSAKLEFDGKRNRRDVWTVTTKPYKGAHFATFPPDLIEPCILAGSRKGDTVLDPFGGSGTTGYVAKKHERKYVIIDINPNYAELARQRVGA